MRRVITEIQPLEATAKQRAVLTVMDVIGSPGNEHYSQEYSFVIEGTEAIRAAYREAGFTIPPASGRAGSGTTPRGYQPMTTAVIVRPAGHHVRVTTIDRTGGGESITGHELEPGGAERTFYIHSSLDLKVEEYDPAASASTDAETA
jgi:hypothetical protein